MSDEVRVIAESSEHYPPLLREIADPPHQLYIRGNLDILLHPYLLAVVGSRKANHYGKQCIEQLLPPALEAGVVMVSGLAYGIDALAHQAAVAAGKPTIAVLGSGVDDEHIYPRGHISLAHKIIEAGGVIMSEYEPGTPPYLGYFPARNRIIAGLCQATLIVQAAQRSGSLITARLALDANREVVAVPGGITSSLAMGTNRLIRDGARPILDASDLLDLFGLALPETIINRPALTSATQELLVTYLAAQEKPQHVDELAEALNLAMPVLSATLLEVELLGYIEHIGGQQYVKK